LIPASGLEVEAGLPLPEQLVAVQRFMETGDERAAALYATLGTYLGYALPHYAEFYNYRNLLLLGRVTTGPGGGHIIDAARKVLAEEFPDLALEFHQPDEKEKRHGQAMAAASLPALNGPSPAHG
jgi:hypothetical protein